MKKRKKSKDDFEPERSAVLGSLRFNVIFLPFTPHLCLLDSGLYHLDPWSQMGYIVSSDVLKSSKLL